MKLALISFTFNGSQLCDSLCRQLTDMGYTACGYIPEKYNQGRLHRGMYIKPAKENLSQWTKKRFLDSDGILFIGAAGIAVRAIAPYVKDKTTDPAVMVMDETGRFCISLLSGHFGQANKITTLLAGLAGAQPVITTATDLNEKFAVDVFAKENGLKILDMNLAKCISADILEGKKVGFFSDFPIEGKMPKELTPNVQQKHNITLTIKSGQKKNTLSLIPPLVIVGVGCKKGATHEAIQDMVSLACDKAGVLKESICCLSSIDRKDKEPGILKFAEENQLPYLTYSPEELEGIEGTYSDSDFVKKIAGVGNVCERAAVLAGNGRLILKKQAGNGVTVALAVREWKGKI